MEAALIVLLVVLGIALVESQRNTKHALDLVEELVLDEEGDGHDLMTDEQPTDEFEAVTEKHKKTAAQVAKDRVRGKR
jgi:hypothetical protein